MPSIFKTLILISAFITSQSALGLIRISYTVGQLAQAMTVQDIFIKRHHLPAALLKIRGPLEQCNNDHNAYYAIDLCIKKNSELIIIDTDREMIEKSLTLFSDFSYERSNK